MKKIFIFFLAALSVQFSYAQDHGEKATIYLAHLGSVAEYFELPVFHNSKYIGGIKGKNTIKYETAPGNLALTAVYTEVNFASTVHLQAKAGETYYVMADLEGGSYTMKSTPSGELAHYFLSNVTGNEAKIAEMNKVLKKAASTSISGKKKQDYETTYASLIQKSADLTSDSSDYLASTSAAPVTSSGAAATTVYEFGTNKRELAYQQILETKGSYASASGVTGNTTSAVSTVVETAESPEKIGKSEDNETAELKYRRSSLYTMMINDTVREHFGVIKDAFGNFEVSEKFNDHNIGPYLINADGGEKDQSGIISAHLEENGVARELVAKWFNRNQNGEFNMDLIAARGSYNASDLDVLVAGDSQRGTALLADAGEELIGNTFVIVNDYKYVNKEEVAKTAGSILSIVSTVASVAGYDDVALIADATNLGTAALGKGYVVKTTSYLYRLEWNEEVANEFYSTLWIDSRNFDEAKKAAFESSDLFKLRLVGSQSAWADLQSTAFTSKTDQDLIRIATVKATDKAISKLQREYEEFRTKSPLFSGDPLAAKIGLKEGLEKGDRFEVLEQVIDNEGRTTYKRVGKIKVDSGNIWDNTYLSEESEEEASAVEGPEYTLFKGKGDFYSGMLIRQIN